MDDILTKVFEDFYDIATNGWLAIPSFEDSITYCKLVTYMLV